MRGSLKTSEARFSEAKTWLNALLLPHIATLVLLMLVAFAAFFELRADLILELLLAPVLLWLMSGTIGWFDYPHVYRIADYCRVPVFRLPQTAWQQRQMDDFAGGLAVVCLWVCVTGRAVLARRIQSAS